MSDQRSALGFANCRGRVGCSWPGLIEAYRDRLPMAADWTPVTPMLDRYCAIVTFFSAGLCSALVAVVAPGVVQIDE